MDLEDYRSSKNYFMRLFVTYNLVDGKWVLSNSDPIAYYER